MSEVALWVRVRDGIKRYLHSERITERLNDGVPDITYVGGWLELKRLSEWNGKTVRIPWKSPAQPLWLYRWARGGGVAGVLLHIESDDLWLYWRAEGETEWVRWIQGSGVLSRVDWWCRGTPPWSEFTNMLTEERRDGPVRAFDPGVSYCSAFPANPLSDARASTQ